MRGSYWTPVRLVELDIRDWHLSWYLICSSTFTDTTSSCANLFLPCFHFLILLISSLSTQLRGQDLRVNLPFSSISFPTDKFNLLASPLGSDSKIDSAQPLSLCLLTPFTLAKTNISCAGGCFCRVKTTPENPSILSQVTYQNDKKKKKL